MIRQVAVCLLTVLAICSSLPRAYGFSQKGIWVGGNIVVYVYAPDEVKSGDTVQIDIEIKVLNDVRIEYFIVKVEKLFDTLYSKTLWKNQALSKGFKYEETISVKVRAPFLYENLYFKIEAKYSDEYWIYTASPSLLITVVRDITYDELWDAHTELKSNYTSLKWDYYWLNQSYHSLNKSYTWYYNAYLNLRDKYDDLSRKFESANYRISSLESMVSSLSSRISSLESEKAILASELSLTILVALIEAAVILWLWKIRRVKSVKGDSSTEVKKKVEEKVA